MDFHEKIEQRYRADSGRAYHENKRFIPEAAYPWVARLRAGKIAPYVKSADTVLEYGVGNGWNLALLECKRKIGYDLAAHLEAQVHEHGIEFITDLTGVPAGSIDVVICHHVLEHTANPAKVLEELRSLLKPGGWLLVYVPFEKERRYRRYNPNEPNHHVYSWNVQTLGNLVADCDFQLDDGRVARFGYDRVGSVWSVRLRLGEPGYRLIRRLVHVIAPMLEVRIAARRIE